MLAVEGPALELSSEERRRIYEEEKARLAAQQELQRQQELDRERAKKEEKARKSKRNWTAVGILFVLGMIANGISSCQEEHRKAQEEQTRVQAQEEATKKLESITPAQHLAKAKSLLTGWEPNINRIQTDHQRISQARIHLDAIPDGVAEKAEAKRLQDRADRLDQRREALAKKRAQQQEQQAKVLAEKVMRQQRENIRGKLDEIFLGMGLDVDISLQGTNKTTIKMQNILMGRAMVYRLTNETQILEMLQKAGFKHVVFSDGDTMYTYDL